MSEAAQRALVTRRVCWTASPALVFPGIAVTGQVPRMNHYEDVGGAFFLDKECQTPDLLLDDQALVMASPRGLIIIFGCAHAGIVNTIAYVSKLVGKENIYAVIGGMHLLNANRIRIANTVEALRKYKIQKIIPLHCTGTEAMAHLKTTFVDKRLHLGVGGQVVL